MRFLALFLVVFCVFGCTPALEIAPEEEQAPAEEAEDQPFETRAHVTVTGVGEAFEAIAECPEGSRVIDGYCEAHGPGAGVLTWTLDTRAVRGHRCAAYTMQPKAARIRATAVCE